MAQPLDCLVIGAGPAGLTAAIYLSRFHLRIAVVDAGKSRAAMIPRTHNHAGYPGGVAGTELLARMRQQAGEFGVEVEQALVEKLVREGEVFVAEIDGRRVEARSVLLASGVVNNRPPVAPEIHDVALERGLLRYCPICDGYEVTDKRVGVIGSGNHGCAEALFLRTYTRDVSLIAPDGEHALSDKDQQALRDAGVTLVNGPCHPLRIDGGQIIVSTAQGECGYDSVYPALGSVIRSELAVALGAEASEEGCLVIDAHQRTSIAGLYAAGDVTKGLDQISSAMGQAAVAATAIRNDLAKDALLLRER
ncbi:thioredoxin reductase (NADPH) [Novosphingobium hassiacum]|uniref:Thioredoxin reductase n=1 Tax=Novosphingobium hassiacum TaxID=173676 RepID=A0A7W6EWB7_9SPHN|nr:NAD(P)/FAD-dependent oxidoreductase [Novosphingobium hassiacum]MBB3860629.1 thioredoxin reductase (NADPH) [Novosphingobium hassiacum]